MALSTQPYKGARDFYPEDKRVQDYMFAAMRRVCQRFGYEEYDAPILEPLELYAAKSGEEIVNEQTYTFVDRGDRQVAIRPEMTPTVSRMVAARRQELAYPLRWFSIPNLWRYERPQRGRLREHWQLNVDIFGEPGLSAEHEVILLADNLLKELGAKHNMYEIRLNSRMFMDVLLKDYFGLSDVQAHTLSKLIDRKNKMDAAVFEADVDALCSPSQKDEGLHERILGILKVSKLDELPAELQQQATIKQLKGLMDLLEQDGLENVVFDITLMRGFDYYTDVVFEVFDTNPENNRSMFGGGRYDGLVVLFGVEPIATVGFGMGDVTLANFLQTHELLPELHSATDVLLVLIGDVYQGASKLAAELREMGLNVSIDATDRKIDKKLKSATKQGTRYVLFVGSTELAEEQYPLKDLVTGQEEKHSAQRIVSVIKDYRKQ